MTQQPYPPLRPQPPVRPRPRRGGTPWTLILGVVVLAILATALALALLLGRGDGSPVASGASPSPSSPAATPTVPPASASPSASASSGPGGFAPDTIVATAVDSLTLRDEAGLNATIQWRLPVGTLGFVISGPMQADDLPWYQLSGMGLPYGSGCVTPEPGGLLECPAWLGWAAAVAPDGTAYLAPATPPACPPPPHTIVSLSGIGFTLRLICFNAEPITFRGWWPGGAAPGGDCAAATTEIGWLVCQNLNPNSLGADPSESGGRFTVSLDPATGVVMPDGGQWVDVTGHFDDPAAPRCASVAETMGTDAGSLVFSCRLQFVLSSVVVAPAP
jgi:hypothetical protein